MTPFSKSKKRGCPTCDGVDPKSCLRCKGKTRMCDWYNTDRGWAFIPTVTIGENSGRLDVEER